MPWHWPDQNEKMKANVDEYLNADISFLIEECVHDIRIRKILKDHLIDGLSYKELSDKYHLGDRQLERIVSKQGDRLLLEIYPILKAQGKFEYDLTKPNH